jgi:branched-chain amino acid transport system ATP-binding protein
MTTTLLEIRNLSVFYGAVQALRGVSLSVHRGAIACLIGANGAGKSTVLRVLSGLKRPSTGEVLFEGSPLLDLPPHERVGLGVVQCPEGRGIFPNLTVEENLDLGAYVRSDREGVRKDLDHAFALFPRLAERRGQSAGTLSGGEQQMLAIGRALLSRPKLLLLDEPSLGLAPQVTELIFETILRINREGTTILLVEQNAQKALEISQEAYVLETGDLFLQGKARDLLCDPRVKEAYLGEAV